MKLDIQRLAIVIVFLWSAIGPGVSSGVQAQTVSDVPTAEALLSAAMKTAKAENKIVFVEFRASWCQWCKRLDAMLTGPEFNALVADNFVLVNLTVQESDDKKALENPGAQDLMTANNGAGLPFFMFLNSDGKKLADSMVMPDNANIGYPVTPEEIQAFNGLLEKTAPRLNNDQRRAIVRYLEEKAKTIK
jgi:thiol:disulfide interchange protein